MATEMQGFVIKYCQVLAGRPDLVPDAYIDRLKYVHLKYGCLLRDYAYQRHGSRHSNTLHPSP